MKHSKTTLIAAALGLLVASAMPAHAGDDKVLNYVKSSDGTLVRDSNKDCVRSSDKTDVRLEECGYAKPVAKEPVVEVAVVEEAKVIETIVINDIQFGFDSAELNAADKAKLDDVAARLKQYDGKQMNITGYTDTSGPEDYNLKLSERRANAVADYLASAGANRSNMTVSGMGEANPVADNGTREGRMRNRRVEVEVLGN
jgi:outer membrane protein OmpA-like peptidoglycan-associated protein